MGYKKLIITTFNILFLVSLATSQIVIIDRGLPDDARLYPRLFTFPKGQDVERGCSLSVAGYTLDTWAANGGKFKIVANHETDIYDIRIIITLTHIATD